jgi:hypothetical protein
MARLHQTRCCHHVPPGSRNRQLQGPRSGNSMAPCTPGVCGPHAMACESGAFLLQAAAPATHKPCRTSGSSALAVLQESVAFLPFSGSTWRTDERTSCQTGQAQRPRAATCPCMRRLVPAAWACAARRLAMLTREVTSATTAAGQLAGKDPC